MIPTESYDVIIIGTGAGGGTLARRLAPSGKRILILERGNFLPREKENWDSVEVFQKMRYHTMEKWRDRDGKAFMAHTGYFVGGNTKVYGGAMFRLRERDFETVQHKGGISPEWPVKYRDFEPYYMEAEALYEVHGKRGVDPTEPPMSADYPFPPLAHEPRIQELHDKLKKNGRQPFQLPLALKRNESDPLLSKCIRCSTCDGFPCLVDAKADADLNGIRPAMEHNNVTLLVNAHVQRLLTNGSAREISTVEAEIEGEKHSFRGDIVVVSAGAINSAALLLGNVSDKHPNGLANSSDQVGRNYMRHLNDAMLTITTKRNPTVFQKTLAMNDYYWGEKDFPFPMGHIQLLGKTDQGTIGADAPFFAPGLVLGQMAKHSVDWWLTAEDLPHPENRVLLGKSREINLHQRDRYHEHFDRLLARWTSELKAADDTDRLIPLSLYLQKKIPTMGVAHQNGTCRFGEDPKTSVLNIFCQTHDVDNLYVVDGSFFCSSGAVNPSLTIAANGGRSHSGTDGLEPVAWRLIPGSARLQRAGGRILRPRTFWLQISAAFDVIAAFRKACFGKMPKPARGTRALPRIALFALALPFSLSAAVEVTAIQMNVANLHESVAFYTNVLQFALASEREATAHLHLGKETLILRQPSAAGRPIPRDLQANDRSFQHIAIAVGDIDAAYAHLLQHNAQIVSAGVQRLPDWNFDSAQIRALYFRDPDGHFLELIQFPPNKGEPRWHRRGGALFRGIDHTAVVVAEMKRSAEFYRDRLGFSVIGQSFNYGGEQELLNRVAGSRVRITSLRGAKGPGVELLQYEAPGIARTLPGDALPNDLSYWRVHLRTTRRDVTGGGHDPDGHALLLEPRSANTSRGEYALEALKQHWPRYLMEGAELGIFMIVALWLALALEHPQARLHKAIASPLLRRFFFGLGIGITVVLLIYSTWGRQSGAQFNPAVTLAMLYLHRIQPWDAFFYIIVQFIGGWLGVILAAAPYRKASAHKDVKYVVTEPGRQGVAAAFAAEFIISFILMATLRIVYQHDTLKSWLGYFAGFLLLVYITFESPFSGMSLNPARSVASAIPARSWKAMWIYFVAPPLAMLLAAFFVQ